MADPDEGNGVRGQLVGWLVQALPAIAGGVGFVGFVAALGAAIVWTRFAAAQLPADQAVAKIPKSDLVGIGAVSLVAFLVLGLLAVLLVYLLQEERGRNLAKQVEAASEELGTARARVASIQQDLTLAVASAEGYIPPDDQGIPPPVLALSFQRDRTLEAIACQQAKLTKLEREAAGPSAPRLRALVVIAAVEIAIAIALTDSRTSTKVLLCVGFAVGLALAVLIESRRQERSRPRPREDGRAAAEGSPNLWSWWRVVDLILAAILPLAAVALFSHDRWLVLFAALAAALLGMGNLAIARLHPRRFFWYGLAVFISVLLFGAVLEGIRTIRDPSVQPAAALLKDGRAVRGLYVTETDNRLYFARVDVRSKGSDKDPRKRSGRLFWLPRSEVQSYAVGPLENARSALASSQRLLDELRLPDLKPKEPAATPPAAARTP